MQLILFIGIPGAGKSSFYKARFYRTHLRLNLDMLRTRHREQVLYVACLESKTQVVIDNTNLTKEHRARYIAQAHEAGYEVHGYFFESRVADAKVRNALREGEERLRTAPSTERAGNWNCLQWRRASTSSSSCGSRRGISF